MDQEYDDLLKILLFTNEFQKIRRKNFVPGESPRRFENDAEHSFQVALACWYLAQKFKPELDVGLIIKFALVHDLIEVYTGDLDPYMHSNDPEFHQKKADKEKQAFQKMKVDLADFPEILNLIEEYEEKQSPESRFVYTMDKLIAIINIAEIDKRTLENCGVSRITMEKTIGTKISKDEFIHTLSLKWLAKVSNIEGYFAEEDYIPEYKKQFITKL